MDTGLNSGMSKKGWKPFKTWQLILLNRLYRILPMLMMVLSFPVTGDEVGVFGPVQFTRRSGAPVAETHTVIVTNPAASYRLIVINGRNPDNAKAGGSVGRHRRPIRSRRRATRTSRTIARPGPPMQRSQAASSTVSTRHWMKIWPWRVRILPTTQQAHSQPTIAGPSRYSVSLRRQRQPDSTEQPAHCRLRLLMFLMICLAQAVLLTSRIMLSLNSISTEDLATIGFMLGSGALVAVFGVAVLTAVGFIFKSERQGLIEFCCSESVKSSKAI